MLALACLLFGCGESEADKRAREAREWEAFLNNVVGISCPVLAIGGVFLIWWSFKKLSEANDRARKKFELEKQQAEEVKQRAAYAKYSAEQQVLRQKEEVERRRAMRSEAAIVVSYFKEKLLGDCLIIDSNIWMNKQYDSFFQTLGLAIAASGVAYTLPGVQFDEICNIKKRTSFDDPRSRAARLAIDRIEQLQKGGLLRIDGIKLDAIRGAYADPELIKYLVSALEQKRLVCFIADDKELRVRVREHLQRFPEDQWHVAEMEALISDCEKVAAAEISPD